MVSCELDIKLRWHQAKSEITTKCDSGRFQRRRERGGRRGRPPRKTNRRTKPKPWVIYTFKSCCLILQQGGEMRRSQPSTQSVPLWLGWGVRLVGVQVWGHHLNKGPLRNFAQSCLDIQVCSAGQGGQARPEENREQGGRRKRTLGTRMLPPELSTTAVQGLGCMPVCVWAELADGWLPSLVNQVSKPCLMLGRGQTGLTWGWKPPFLFQFLVLKLCLRKD